MTELLDGIGLNTQPQFWISVLQIIWINVLLSGDNAIVIALACRNLPKKQRFTGMVLGTGVALVLRLIFATIVSTLMLLPYVKIAGGLALFWIAVKLLVPGETSDNGPHHIRQSLASREAYRRCRRSDEPRQRHCRSGSRRWKPGAARVRARCQHPLDRGRRKHPHGSAQLLPLIIWAGAGCWDGSQAKSSPATPFLPIT
jgi:Membrane protein TerC, possibly involved in tellurium resistance